MTRPRFVQTSAVKKIGGGDRALVGNEERAPGSRPSVRGRDAMVLQGRRGRRPGIVGDDARFRPSS